MTRRFELAFIAAVALASCRRSSSWTDDGRVPANALQQLADEVPNGSRWRVRAMAAEYLDHMVYNVKKTFSREHPRSLFEDEYEDARHELGATKPEKRLEALALLVFEAGLRRVIHDADGLAHRRLALAAPWLLSIVPSGFDDEQAEFEEAPRLTIAEIEERARESEMLLNHLLRTYRPLISDSTACETPMDRRIALARALLRNARGDFRVTTDRLYTLLARIGYPTEAMTPFDRGMIVEPRSNCPR